MTSIWEYVIPAGVIGIVSGVMTHRKGWTAVPGFALGLGLNFLGMIVAVALPERKKSER